MEHIRSRDIRDTLPLQGGGLEGDGDRNPRRFRRSSHLPLQGARRNVEQGPLWGCDRAGAHKHAVKSGAASHFGGPVYRGAGAPVSGDATVEPAVSASTPASCASPGSDPQRGPSSALRRAIHWPKPTDPAPPSAGALGWGWEETGAVNPSPPCPPFEREGMCQQFQSTKLVYPLITAVFRRG